MAEGRARIKTELYENNPQVVQIELLGGFDYFRAGFTLAAADLLPSILPLENRTL